MAAFGSMNPAVIKEFHIIMSEMLQQNPMNEAYSSAMVDARDGDSSGHYPSEYSVGSNPTFARGSHGKQNNTLLSDGYDIEILTNLNLLFMTNR